MSIRSSRSSRSSRSDNRSRSNRSSRVTDNDIENLLVQWARAKEEIAKQEKRIEKFKKLANRILDGQDEKSIRGDEYTLTRRDMSRTTITKHDVPDQIWEKYARPCTYQAYFLSKNKTK